MQKCSQLLLLNVQKKNTLSIEFLTILNFWTDCIEILNSNFEKLLPWLFIFNISKTKSILFSLPSRKNILFFEKIEKSIFLNTLKFYNFLISMKLKDICSYNILSN